MKKFYFAPFQHYTFQNLSSEICIWAKSESYHLGKITLWEFIYNCSFPHETLILTTLSFLMLLYFVQPTPKMHPGQNRWLKALDVDDMYRENQRVLKYLEIRPLKQSAPIPTPVFLKWWWPFIYWCSESIQKGSFELCVGHTSQAFHRSPPGHGPANNSSRRRPGRACLKCSANSGFAFGVVRHVLRSRLAGQRALFWKRFWPMNQSSGSNSATPPSFVVTKSSREKNSWASTVN